MSRKVVIVGATSRMAAALAREMGRRGDALHLIGRDLDEVQRLSQDIACRFNVPVSCSQLDMCSGPDFVPVFEQAVNSLGSADGFVFAAGMLGDQASDQHDAEAAVQVVETNYVSAVRFLTMAADYLETRKAGFLAVITSVAGDRGRMSNYIYGSSKGALSLFAQGLRARLCKSGVHVLTVKPGFVDTKMTFGRSGMFLVASPETVAASINAAIDKKTDVLYVPRFWELIMLIIKLVPEKVFKKTKL